MKRKRFTEEQIIAILREQGAGKATAEGCRRHGISPATFYAWKSKCGALEMSEAKRRKTLKDENRRLKKLLAEQMLDDATLKELLTKTFDARREEVRRELGDQIEGLLSTPRVHPDQARAEGLSYRRRGDDCPARRSARRCRLQRRVTIEVSSVPLSLTTISGLPRRAINSSSSQAIRQELHGRLRDELLTETMFRSLAHARDVIAGWRADYNGEQPHTSLDWLAPNEFPRSSASDHNQDGLPS